MNIPNLAGVATADLVEKIGGSGFQASYINWSRTLHMLREHAPGWLPELVSGDSGIVHNAPVGAFLLIRFRHTDGTVTPKSHRRSWTRAMLRFRSPRSRRGILQTPTVAGSAWPLR